MKDLKTNSEFTYASVAEYIKSIAKKLYDNRNGALMSQNKFTEIEKGLRKIGWQADQYGSFDEFWDSLLEFGGWWDPFGGRDPYSPKINFKDKLPYPITRNDIMDKTTSQKKLYLNIFRKTLDYKGSMSLYPVLVEQFGHNRSVFYKLWAEINPETARRHYLSERSQVNIKTSKGKFPAVIIYNPSVTPGSLDVPFGLGHDVLGDKSGINPLMFSENIFDAISGKPSFNETPAEIESSS
jgi:anaerobic selenocysteine-containing dehydrogenase